MSTAPSPEIWNNILKGNVEKDDLLWTEYLDKAAVFDVRMVDEWNKIVDVLLVYVALFISVLTSFIGRTTQFQRDPVDISNDLLVVIYNQLAAQYNNTPIPPVDPRSYFNQSQADHDAAVTQNALLYSSLSLSIIIVSVIALAVKLWLVSYSQQAFSVGSPYDRAMKRQQAYNGVLVWKMGRVINMLPVILLIALYLFGIYVSSSVWAVQEDIGAAVGILLGVGLIFLVFTSIVAAILPGCPFRSAFSGVIRFFFEKLRTLLKRIPLDGPLGLLSMLGLILLSSIGIILSMMVAKFDLSNITPVIPLIWILILVHSAVFLFALPPPFLKVIKDMAVFGLEPDHKPQKYNTPYAATLVFFIVSVWLILFFYFQRSLNPFLHAIGVWLVGSFTLMFCFMYKSISMADTGEIDAIAWLLITTPQYPATFFKKAGQMTGVGSIGHPYRPRLLESLLPLLSSLITLYHTPEHHNSDTHSPESASDDRRLRTNRSLVDKDKDPRAIGEDSHLDNLEIYIACLARLSEFTDYDGYIHRLWEDARRHPKLKNRLLKNWWSWPILNVNLQLV